MRKRILIVFCLVLLVLSSSGCNFSLQKLFHSTSQDDVEKLIKVEIVFTDGEKLTGYVKDLGIEQNGKVYVGGSSLNYIYDAEGNVVGSYNYQRVVYMKIIPEKEGER